EGLARVGPQPVDPLRHELGVGQLLGPLDAAHDDAVGVIGVGRVDGGDGAVETFAVRDGGAHVSSASSMRAARTSGVQRSAVAPPDHTMPASLRWPPSIRRMRPVRSPARWEARNTTTSDARSGARASRCSGVASPKKAADMGVMARGDTALTRIPRGFPSAAATSVAAYTAALAQA